MWLSSLLLLAACPEPGEKRPFDCEVGFVTPDGWSQEEAELVLGFQGLLYLMLQVRSDEAPDRIDIVSSLTVGDEEPGGGWQTDVRMEDGASEPFNLYLTGTLGEWTGADAFFSSRVQGPRTECFASGPVLLLDADPCIEAGDTPICPEDP